VYVGLAVAFAAFVWIEYGAAYSGQFVAGYLTEYSLSVDNLFVFLVIMTSFAVPAALQHRVLLVGIVIALILRGILIVVGAEIIHRFQGVFFLFAAFLFFTAWKVWSGEEEEPNPDSNRMVTFVSSHVPTTSEYDGTRIVTRIDGKRFLTPLALVMLAIGTTDLLFALDSIPAVFGITSEAYLVFAANAFALMGLRQLYFLIRDLITKLRHLNKGIALILAFIGIKLLLEACHSVLGWNVPLVPVWLSLVMIIVILGATTLLSLRPEKGSPAP
jgi:tellurite resistance protein TerC